MSSSKRKIIIGITGAFGSGKSTAARFFEKKGFVSITLSSYLEKEAREEKLPLTRKVLQNLGNEMRLNNGNGVLMQKALFELRNHKKIVIDGVRNTGEIDELKKYGGILLAIVADRKNRFERLRKIKRREKLTPKIFEKLDLRDLGINEKVSGLQTAFCIALADVFIDSNEDVESFEKDLDSFLSIYGE